MGDAPNDPNAPVLDPNAPVVPILPVPTPNIIKGRGIDYRFDPSTYYNKSPLAPPLQEDDSAKVNLVWQTFVQVATCASFLIMIFSNTFAQSWAPYTLREISEQWAGQLRPAGWAFSIWGVIFGFCGLFTVYQALPSAWVPFRNDDMIYNQMNFIPAINFLLNALWTPIFTLNSLAAFIISTFIIIAMLITDLTLMVISGRNYVYWFEVFSVRVPFSLYSGWLSAATILQFQFLLKSQGMVGEEEWVQTIDPPETDWLNFMMFMSEEAWTCIISWVAFLIYEVATFSERNPVFGGVFVWAMSAILAQNLDTTPQNTWITYNAIVILILTVTSLVILSSYLIFEEFQPWYEPLSFYDNGIIGKTDWSQMFSDLDEIVVYFRDYFIGAYTNRVSSA